MELGIQENTVVSSFSYPYLVRARAAAPGLRLALIVKEISPEHWRMLEALGAYGINPGIGKLNPKEVAKLRKKGYQVHVWTVNDARSMKKAVAAGASGIITDYPELALKTLFRSIR